MVSGRRALQLVRKQGIISYIKTRRGRLRSLDARMVAAIRRRGRGAVFVPADFLQTGSRLAVDVALHRLVGKGTIRRLAVYFFDDAPK